MFSEVKTTYVTSTYDPVVVSRVEEVIPSTYSVTTTTVPSVSTIHYDFPTVVTTSVPSKVKTVTLRAKVVPDPLPVTTTTTTYYPTVEVLPTTTTTTTRTEYFF